MAWKLSGRKLPVFNGWQKNALMLRTIVLSIPEPQTITDAMLETFDAMRSFNRGTIEVDELRSRIAKAGTPNPHHNMLHEPLEFHGWTVDATLINYYGATWWLAHVTKRTKTVSTGDRNWLYRVLDVLGCDPERDKVSLLPLEDLVTESVPCIYAWPNTFDRHEIQISPSGDFTIVAKGTKLPEGSRRLP